MAENQILFEKRVATKILRFTQKEHKGHSIGDLRLHYTASNGDVLPTKSGCQLNALDWMEFLPCLQAYIDSFMTEN